MYSFRNFEQQGQAKCTTTTYKQSYKPFSLEQPTVLALLKSSSFKVDVKKEQIQQGWKIFLLLIVIKPCQRAQILAETRLIIFQEKSVYSGMPQQKEEEATKRKNASSKEYESHKIFSQLFTEEWCCFYTERQLSKIRNKNKSNNLITAITKKENQQKW